jgi:ADP-ribosyl-[dinitrogen reductase] hydrolase
MREKKTSEDDQLRLDFVQTRLQGNIAITICPGKYQPGGLSANWHRNLDLDLQHISDYDTEDGNPVSTIVTLIEDHEFVDLQVTELGRKAEEYGFTWIHLPIKDGWPPHQGWLKDWNDKKSQLIAALRKGEHVMIHCKGGLGRAGTVSALLLHEIGDPMIEAIDLVRDARSEQCIDRWIPKGAQMSQQEWLLVNFS